MIRPNAGIFRLTLLLGALAVSTHSIAIEIPSEYDSESMDLASGQAKPVPANPQSALDFNLDPIHSESLIDLTEDSDFSRVQMWETSPIDYSSPQYNRGADDTIPVRPIPGEVSADLSATFESPSDGVSISEILAEDALEKDWKNTKKEIRETGKNVKAALDEQVDGLKGMIADGFFSDGGDFGNQNHRPGYSSSPSSPQSSAPGAGPGGAYADDGVPAIYVLFHKIINFKNDNPVLFYSLLALAVIVLVIQSLFVRVTRRTRRPVT